MLKVLLRVRLSTLGTWLTGASRSKKQQSKGKLVLFALLMLYAAFAVGFAMFGTFMLTAGAFHQVGLDWLYFSIYAMICFALMFVGSVFTTKAQLFEAKDNELLLSMPLRPRDILGSRMIMLLIINYFFALVVTVPALIAWLRACPMSGASALAFILVFLALPFFTLAISSLFGWLISLLTRHVRRKSLMSTVFSLALLLAYMYFVTNANEAMLALAQNSELIAGKIGAVAPLYWIGAAIGEANFAYLAVGLLIMILPFILAYWLLSATFIKTATTRRGFARIEYKGTQQKTRTVKTAMFIREMSRFVSSSAYILNAGMGALMLVIAAVVLLVKGDVLVATLNAAGFDAMIAPFAICAIASINGMTTISAPSVSMEGKSMWITRSLPVSTKAILKAKIAVHLSVAAPATLFASIAAAIVIKPEGLMLLLVLVSPLVYTLLSALLGLTFNIKHPGLNWINETQAVKSGVSVIISMALSWLAAMATVVAVLLFGALLPMVLATLVVAAVCALIYKWIMTSGVRRYNEL